MEIYFILFLSFHGITVLHFHSSRIKLKVFVLFWVFLQKFYFFFIILKLENRNKKVFLMSTNSSIHHNKFRDSLEILSLFFQKQ